MGRKRWRDDDEDMSEAWREYRRPQQQRRSERLEPRTADILALRKKGYDVRAITAYQFRIDGQLDLYPIHRRYHFLPTNKRGDYVAALPCAIRHLKSATTV